MAVVWESAALDAMLEIAGRDRRLARRISGAVTSFIKTGHGDVKKLQGQVEQWRIRVGDWRVLFRFEVRDETERTIHVLAVDNRRDAY